MLGAALIVLFLATRGTWSFMWNFPYIFGGVMAVLALLSLRPARRTLWKPRLALALTTVIVCAFLPGLHVRGVLAKMDAYERRVGDVLIDQVAPEVAFVEQLNPIQSAAGTFRPHGRISLLNFWATWCGPCVEEIPALQQFWNEGREQGIDVIGITKLYEDIGPAEEARQIEAFLAERQVTYPILIGDTSSSAHAAYRVESLPTSVLIDRDGQVVAVGAGIRGTQRLMKEAERLADSASLALD